MKQFLTLTVVLSSLFSASICAGKEKIRSFQGQVDEVMVWMDPKDVFDLYPSSYTLPLLRFTKEDCRYYQRKKDGKFRLSCPIIKRVPKDDIVEIGGMKRTLCRVGLKKDEVWKTLLQDQTCFTAVNIMFREGDQLRSGHVYYSMVHMDHSFDFKIKFH